MKRLLICVLVIFLLLPVATFADDVKVGTYIINVGRYEAEISAYTIDFYLWFKWDGMTSPEEFEFMNGRAEHIDLMINETGYLFYRVQGEFYEETNLKDFPLDTQKLSIKIEDKTLTTDYLNYVPDHEEIGISPELHIMTWTIAEDNVFIENIEYPNWEETYSRYTHEISIQRPISSIIRILVPVIFIALTGWLVFFFPLHKLGEKLALIGTALLSSVVIHLFITESIPAVGYLTLGDKIAISLYALLVLSILGIVSTDHHINKGKHRHSEKVNRKYATISLIGAIIVFIILLLV